MTLLIADNFDPYAAIGDLTERGWQRSGLTFDTTDKKDDSQSVRNSETTYYLQLPVSNHTGRVYVSFWFRWSIESVANGVPLVPVKIVTFRSLNASFDSLTLMFGGSGRLAWRRLGVISLALSEQVSVPDVWYHIELCGRTNTSISANDVRCKINGVLDSNLTLAAGTNTAGHAAFPYVSWVIFRSGEWHSNYDSIVIWDDDGAGQFSDAFIGMIQMQRLQPDDNGTTSDFVGSDADSTNNYLHINEDNPDDDTSYIESSTVTDVDLHAYPALSPSPGSIVGVQLLTIAKKTDVDARGIKPLTRVAGTNYQGDEVSPTNGTYEWTTYMWEDNPDDAADWEEADVNGAEFGVEVTT